jgi:hypothetical protein
MPSLSITTPERFKRFVEGLDIKGHDDDRRRKKKRKELLVLAKYEEKEFTQGDLTQTSQLVRLGVQTLERQFQDFEKKPEIISMPGFVTARARMTWKVTGCLAKANSLVLDSNGEVKHKSEIRGITHLHHALDACVLALASHFLPKHGGVWDLMKKRNLTRVEEGVLKRLGVFGNNADGRLELMPLTKSLHDQIRERLAEKRVCQHQPRDMGGLACDETVYRVFDPKDSTSTARRLFRWFTIKLQNGELKKLTKLPDPADPTESWVLLTARKRLYETGIASGKTLHEGKYWRWIYILAAKSSVHGINPGASEGKLKQLKGAKILGDNFGVAWIQNKVQPAFFRIVRPRLIWPEINRLRREFQDSKIQLIQQGSIIRFREKDGSKAILRIFGCGERPGRGIYFDTAAPDALERQREVQISAFAKGQAELLRVPLTGVACPTTSSALTAHSVR